MLAKMLASRMRLWARVLAGKAYNLAGVPGIVRDCDYSASVCNARIRVSAKEMFTIITVNGLDIYFHRLTGRIDGVGFGTTANSYTTDEAPESAPLPEPASPSPRHRFQKRMT
jgi:hypothetical protein